MSIFAPVSLPVTTTYAQAYSLRLPPPTPLLPSSATPSSSAPVHAPAPAPSSSASASASASEEQVLRERIKQFILQRPATAVAARDHDVAVAAAAASALSSSTSATAPRSLAPVRSPPSSSTSSATAPAVRRVATTNSSPTDTPPLPGYTNTSTNSTNSTTSTASTQTNARAFTPSKAELDALPMLDRERAKKQARDELARMEQQRARDALREQRQRVIQRLQQSQSMPTIAATGASLNEPASAVTASVYHDRRSASEPHDALHAFVDSALRRDDASSAAHAADYLLPIAPTTLLHHPSSSSSSSSSATNATLASIAQLLQHAPTCALVVAGLVAPSSSTAAPDLVSPLLQHPYSHHMQHPYDDHAAIPKSPTLASAGSHVSSSGGISNGHDAHSAGVVMPGSKAHHAVLSTTSGRPATPSMAVAAPGAVAATATASHAHASASLAHCTCHVALVQQQLLLQQQQQYLQQPRAGTAAAAAASSASSSSSARGSTPAPPRTADPLRDTNAQLAALLDSFVTEHDPNGMRTLLYHMEMGGAAGDYEAERLGRPAAALGYGRKHPAYKSHVVGSSVRAPNGDELPIQTLARLAAGNFLVGTARSPSARAGAGGAGASVGANGAAGAPATAVAAAASAIAQAAAQDALAAVARAVKKQAEAAAATAAVDHSATPPRTLTLSAATAPLARGPAASASSSAHAAHAHTPIVSELHAQMYQQLHPNLKPNGGGGSSGGVSGIFTQPVTAQQAEHERREKERLDSMRRTMNVAGLTDWHMEYQQRVKAASIGFGRKHQWYSAHVLLDSWTPSLPSPVELERAVGARR